MLEKMREAQEEYMRDQYRMAEAAAAHHAADSDMLYGKYRHERSLRRVLTIAAVIGWLLAGVIAYLYWIG